MFGKKTAQLPTPSTIIGTGITLEAATLTGTDSVRIDGCFYGDIDLDGSLVLGESSKMEGRVRAKYIAVAGTVRGNVECPTVLHLAPTAHVTGDIKAHSLIAEEGSQLSGLHQVGNVAALSGSELELLENSKEVEHATHNEGIATIAK